MKLAHAFVIVTVFATLATTHGWAEDLYEYGKPRAAVDATGTSIITKRPNGPDMPLVLCIGSQRRK